MVIAHIFISGFVQGIGFRQFIKKNAEEHGLAGWVRNLTDGRVEAVLKARKEDVEKMIMLCRKGPFLAEVENVEVRWEEREEKFEGFEIIM